MQSLELVLPLRTSHLIPIFQTQAGAGYFLLTTPGYHHPDAINPSLHM